MPNLIRWRPKPSHDPDVDIVVAHRQPGWPSKRGTHTLSPTYGDSHVSSCQRFTGNPQKSPIALHRIPGLCGKLNLKSPENLQIILQRSTPAS
eukprot:1150845-Amorphochlora_amoeboformis.AAC.1